MRLINGRVFGNDAQFHMMDVSIDGDVIQSLNVAEGSVDEIIDCNGAYVIPGLVDIHIHGAMGSDFCDGAGEAVQVISQYLLSQGVTSFLGTTMALPMTSLEGICSMATDYIDHPLAGGATLLGINMEGPFFNVDRCGAQNPAYIIKPDFDMFLRLNELSGGNIKTVAIAPEVEGGLQFVAKAKAQCSVSLAHSCAGYDTAMAAFSAGASHATHLFNGMPAFNHRDTGIVGAAADSDAYVELICDGIHLHPSMVRSVFKLFGDDRVCLISDAMRACGMPDGQYELGGQLVSVAGGMATIGSGSLAGSVTVLTDCMRRAVQFGIPLESAIKAATMNPAASVGLGDRVGSIAVGKSADILVLEPDLSIRYIISCGVLQH